MWQHDMYAAYGGAGVGAAGAYGGMAVDTDLDLRSQIAAAAGGGAGGRVSMAGVAGPAGAPAAGLTTGTRVSVTNLDGNVSQTDMQVGVKGMRVM